MPSCATCNRTIVFGGPKVGGRRFCSTKCANAPQLRAVLDIEDQLSNDAVAEYVLAVYDGVCPRCRKPGQVNVHDVYRGWSLLIISSFGSSRVLACRACAVRRQVLNITVMAGGGWWSMPGMILTPAFLVLGIGSAIRSATMTGPSRAFLELAPRMLAQELYVNAGRTPLADDEAEDDEPDEREST